VSRGREPKGPSLRDLPPDWLTRSLPEVRADVLARIEKAYLEAQLRATGGLLGEVAKRAEISPRSLYDKMRQHGLRKEDYRD
jgi:DNA-binding NtrC family response regulator